MLRALALAAAAAAAAAADDDVVKVPFAAAPAAPAVAASRFSGTFPSDGRPYNATQGLITDGALMSVQIGYPDGCVNHAATSATARQHSCEYAVNGGFFDFPPHAACEGDLIINGTTFQFPDMNRTFVGWSRASKSTLIGYTTPATYAAFQLDFLVSGNGWLVRDGAQYVNASREFNVAPGAKPPSFVSLLAPRTAVGVKADGTVLLVVVDGIEGSSGPNLYDFADLLISLGALHAVNMDGGGSSTAAYQGKLYNDAHCADTPVICERDVSSIVCVAYPAAA